MLTYFQNRIIEVILSLVNKTNNSVKIFTHLNQPANDDTKNNKKK